MNETNLDSNTGHNTCIAEIQLILAINTNQSINIILIWRQKGSHTLGILN